MKGILGRESRKHKFLFWSEFHNTIDGKTVYEIQAPFSQQNGFSMVVWQKGACLQAWWPGKIQLLWIKELSGQAKRGWNFDAFGRPQHF